MFKVLQIDHVELFVPDRYEAARWYERTLGLQVVPECEPWAAGRRAADDFERWWQHEAGALRRAACDSSAQTAAFRRVAFRVTAGGFAEFLRRLPDLALEDSRQRPVTTESVVDHHQAYSIYFDDPYGHLLEVTTYDYDEASAFLAQAIE